jgi:hypothetical protein
MPVVSTSVSPTKATIPRFRVAPAPTVTREPTPTGPAAPLEVPAAAPDNPLLVVDIDEKIDTARYKTLSSTKQQIQIPHHRNKHDQTRAIFL